MTADEIRALALSLPETVELPHFERTSFRVAGKIFSTMTADGELVMVKLPIPIKEAVAQTHPDAFVPLPGAWGRGGATMLRIAGMKDEALADLIRLAWRETAPRRLAARGAE
ncbi:MAG: MmcQ/YjbR family DNA-binding protein [Pseudomonadota bacterium]